MVPLLLVVAPGAVACIEVEDENATGEGGDGDAQVSDSQVDDVQVTSCVEQVKFGAYTGDAAWSQVWVDVGETAEGYCTQLGENNPAELEAVHEGWMKVEAFLSAAASEEAPASGASDAVLTVTNVVDGDTVDMSDGTTVRLIGWKNSPSSSASPRISPQPTFLTCANAVGFGHRMSPRATANTPA